MKLWLLFQRREGEVSVTVVRAPDPQMAVDVAVSGDVPEPVVGWTELTSAGEVGVLFEVVAAE